VTATLLQLGPVAGERPAEAIVAGLGLSDGAAGGRPRVAAAMIASADGRATVSGTSVGLGHPADRALLRELRTAVDAILVGTGTLRAEGYDRLVRSEERRARRIAAGLAEDPIAVLLTRGFDIPWEAGLFQAPEQPVLIYTGLGGSAPDVPAPVEVVVLDDPQPAAALADLRRRGVRALLNEGGPTLLHGLLAAGVVDELFLTIAPLLTGDETEPTIVSGGRLVQPVGMELLWTLQAGSELYLRYGL
jgi:riboflavin biosynthesis pyrimidine reductase